MRNLALALAAAALAVPAAASAQPASQSKPGAAQQCFFDRDWRGWKAVDEKSMYIRVGIHDIYRVDFSSGCPGLLEPNVHLVTQSHSGSVCSALDLDVKVSQFDGFSTACIASNLTRLSPAEVAALPKKQLP